jgi:hypothetical protein
MQNESKHVGTVDAKAISHVKRNTETSSGNSDTLNYLECFNERNQLIVVLQSDQTTAFIGNVFAISQEHLTFDYIVLDRIIDSLIDRQWEVCLKIGSRHGIFSKPIPCRVVDDSYVESRSMFDIPMRRCSVEFCSPLSLSELQSFT